MPVIEIRAQSPPPADDVAGVLARVNQAVAEALGTPVEHVWSYWRDIARGRHVHGIQAVAEGGVTARAPYVNVIAYRGRTAAEIAATMERIDAVLCDAQGIDRGSSFINWTEARPGRVFTGGSVRVD